MVFFPHGNSSDSKPCMMSSPSSQHHLHAYCMYFVIEQCLKPILTYSFNMQVHTKPQNPNCKSHSSALDIQQHPNPNGFVVPVDYMAYYSLLSSITNIRTLKQLQAYMLITGFHQDIFLETKLVSKYAMLGSLENARLIFDRICQRNVFIWNAMITGCSRNRQHEETLSLYYRMQEAGFQPNNFTFPVVLKACAELSALQEGKEIHYHALKTESESNVFVGAALINMYVKCGCTEDARQVFDKMSERDVVLWTTMIVGYVQNGHANEALRIFHQMQVADVQPDSLTMASVLSACANLGIIEEGKRIHDYIIRIGFESDVSVCNSLVAMYAKCGNLEIARQLFDKMSKKNVISWNAMIAGYAQNGRAKEALRVFHQMLMSHSKPDSITMVGVLPACSHLGALQQGKSFHDYIIRSGFESDVSVATALIDMYAKCGSIQIARKLFDRMPKRDVVSWSAMISGYGMHGHVTQV